MPSVLQGSGLLECEALVWGLGLESYVAKQPL